MQSVFLFGGVISICSYSFWHRKELFFKAVERLQFFDAGGNIIF